MNLKKFFGIIDKDDSASAKENRHDFQPHKVDKIDMKSIEAFFLSRRKRIKSGRHPIDWQMPLGTIEGSLMSLTYNPGRIIFVIVIPDRYGERAVDEVAEIARRVLFGGSNMIEINNSNEKNLFTRSYFINEFEVFG